MGYGISILNGSSRILIDSDQGYPTLYQVGNEVSYASGAAYPSTTNLLFARPSGNSGIVYRGNTGLLYSSSGSMLIREMKAVTAGGFTPATTGYGLNIYNSAGTAIFSATSANYTTGFDIIGVSAFGGLFTSSDWTMPTATYALSTSRMYVLLNTTISAGSGTEGSNQYYEYLPALGTYGTIRAHAYNETIVYLGDAGYAFFSSPATNGNIMAIGYLRG
jgi:hypothetical protein